MTTKVDNTVAPMRDGGTKSSYSGLACIANLLSAMGAPHNIDSLWLYLVLSHKALAEDEKTVYWAEAAKGLEALTNRPWVSEGYSLFDYDAVEMIRLLHKLLEKNPAVTLEYKKSGRTEYVTCYREYQNDGRLLVADPLAKEYVPGARDLFRAGREYTAIHVLGLKTAD